MLENVCDPFGVLLICFLSPNCFHILGVSKDNVAGVFQNVVNRNPILPSGFHAHVLAMVFFQPGSAPPQIPGKRGEPFGFVGSNTLRVCGSNAGYHKRFVNIHPTTNWINDFERNTSSQSKNLREQTGTERSLKD